MSEQEKPSYLAKYSDLFEKMLDSTLLIDPEDYRILDANDSCERMLKTPMETLLGKNLLDWVDETDKPAFAKSLRVIRRRYYPRQFDSKWRTSEDQDLLISTVVCLLKLSDQKDVIQVIAKDVTKEKEAETKAALYLEELQAANKKLEALSITDEMTQLVNFRHFMFVLKNEHTRAKRYDSSYAIIYCDVDNFKHYNDTRGHPAGDEILRGVGTLFKAHTRESDLPARYGGEEFAVLCPGITMDGALVLAERLRSAIAKHPFPYANEQPLGIVSISVGVSHFPTCGDSMDEVLKAADQALYQSKHGGRNRVTLAPKK